MRKLLFLAAQAENAHQAYLAEIHASGRAFTEVQFDEMETFERSKCLPLSIPLMVDAQSRRILGYGVCSMPAKGPLAAVSLRKYGPRADGRKKAALGLFSALSGVIAPQARITTDQNPKYPAWIKRRFPRARHRTVKGRRGAVVGQGELKKIGFDPLFSLNHSCAMFRANVNRLVRRTWCTTKRRDRLEAHLALYVQFHNQELIG